MNNELLGWLGILAIAFIAVSYLMWKTVRIRQTFLKGLPAFHQTAYYFLHTFSYGFLVKNPEERVAVREGAFRRGLLMLFFTSLLIYIFLFLPEQLEQWLGRKG